MKKGWTWDLWPSLGQMGYRNLFWAGRRNRSPLWAESSFLSAGQRLVRGQGLANSGQGLEPSLDSDQGLESTLEQTLKRG